MRDNAARAGKRSPWSWVPSLYFAEGLPYVAVMAVSLVLYKQLGLGNAEITFYTSWLYLPWVVKPLWSPFVDILATKRWWILAMQLLIGAAFGGVAFTIPTSFWLQATLFFFWVMAFSSATHDIAADGFYMIGLDEHGQAMFVGVRSLFYRLATIFGQGFLVMVAGNLQVLFRGSIRYSWSLVFYGVAGLFIAIWLWHNMALPRKARDVGKARVTSRDVWRGLRGSIVTFFTKYPLRPAIMAFLFMLLYRMPEGLLVKVSSLFFMDSGSVGGLGFSPAEYGFVQGTVGVVGLTLGGILGGLAASRDGLRKWLWWMACAITLPDLVYVYLSCAMPSGLTVVSVCVFIEQFGYGFGFTAYMLYLIYYSQGEYSTSHYALCTAIMALSLMLPGLVAGYLQQLVGYQWFFIIVVALCAVTFTVTALIDVDPGFGRRHDGEGDAGDGAESAS